MNDVTRDAILSGTAVITVRPDAHFLHARALLGDYEWQPTYTYRVERVDNDYGVPTYFLHTLTSRPGAEPKFVYTGVVHPRIGTIRRTKCSAFPETSRRFRVASRVLQAVFGNRQHEIAAAGWDVSVAVERVAVPSF